MNDQPVRAGWWDRLSDSERQRLFPGGDKDIDAFLARVELQDQRDGIPAKCEDIDTLLAVARLVASYNP